MPTNPAQWITLICTIATALVLGAMAISSYVEWRREVRDHREDEDQSQEER